MSLFYRIKSGISSPAFQRVELGILFILLALLFIRRINYVQFFIDEGYWIAYSRYFDPLVAGDISAETWADEHALSEQPLLPAYVIGLSRLLAGYHAQDLNQTWNYGADYQTNVAEGRLPSAGLLWWSRLPMALLAAVSGVVIFWLVNQAFSRLAGYIWLGQYMASYYITATLCKAMAESPLLIAVALAGVCGVLALREFQKASATQPVSIRAFRYSLLWFSLMGVCCGLAASSKINGAVAIAGGFLLAAWGALKYKAVLLGLQRALLVLIAGVALVMSAGITFISPQPFLYYDTLDRVSLIYARRLSIMASQLQNFPQDRIDSLSERIEVVPEMMFQELAATRFPGSLRLNLAFNGFGVAVILLQLRRWQSGASRAIAGFTILSLAFTVGVPPLFTPLNWPRYYILPVAFSMIFAALGAAQLITLGYAYVRRQLAARTLPQPGSTR